jgi:hypothetical protein
MGRGRTCCREWGFGNRVGAVRCTALGLATLLGAGCGAGGLSESDIRASAIRRSKDDEQPPANSSPPASPLPASPLQRAGEAPTSQPPRPSTATPKATLPAAAEESSPIANDARDSLAAAPADAPLSDRRQAPSTPLSAVERSRRSAENLGRIIDAILAHYKQHGAFPNRATLDKAGVPLLSWRVALLPHLGHARLYQEFRLTESWNSPHNIKLIEHIPAVFQSPERFDEKTNYLLPVSSNTAFMSNRTLPPRQIEDGVEHTVFVVEADDELAVPWTQPQDYDFDRQHPVRGLGRLRNGNIFLAWGDGSTGAVPATASVESLRAMFTADAGESFTSYSISRPLDDAAMGLASGEATPVAATDAPPTVDVSGEDASSQTLVKADSPPASALAATYLESARAAYHRGDAGDALRWYYASLIAQSERPGAGAHQWVVGLRRPAAAVHFGVGVRTPPAAPGASTAAPQSTPTARRNAMRRVLGLVGAAYMTAIEDHAAIVAPPSLAAATQPQGRQMIPIRPIVRQDSHAISYLGDGSLAQLRKAAIDSACDILVLFDLKGSANRGSLSFSCELLDVARNDALLRLPRIHSSPGAGGLAALERDEDLREAQWRLADCLEEQLAWSDWPDSLKPHHAEARVAALSKAKGLHPLAALAEMCVYRHLQLVDNRQLLAGFRELLGADDGEALLLGDERSQAKVLRRWLPLESGG